jgi:hypothetical protein
VSGGSKQRLRIFHEMFSALFSFVIRMMSFHFYYVLVVLSLCELQFSSLEQPDQNQNNCDDQ